VVGGGVCLISVVTGKLMDLRYAPPPPPPLVGHTDQGYLWQYYVWHACLPTSRGMRCLRHAGALAWRRGPVCACTRVCWCQSINQRSSQSHTHTGRGEAASQRHLRGSKPCRIFTYIYTYPSCMPTVRNLDTGCIDGVTAGVLLRAFDNQSRVCV